MKPLHQTTCSTQPIIPEPQVKTQDVYGALDPVVQAVLTDQNADIDALLARSTHGPVGARRPVT